MARVAPFEIHRFKAMCDEGRGGSIRAIAAELKVTK
jgi:hypothetical protein